MTIKILGFTVTVQKEQKVEALNIRIDEAARKDAVSSVDLTSIKAKLAALRSEE